MNKQVSSDEIFNRLCQEAADNGIVPEVADVVKVASYKEQYMHKGTDTNDLLLVVLANGMSLAFSFEETINEIAQFYGGENTTEEFIRKAVEEDNFSINEIGMLLGDLAMMPPKYAEECLEAGLLIGETVYYQA